MKETKIADALSVVAIVGVVITSILSADGAVKAYKIVRNEETLNNHLKFKEKLKKTWKCYIPAFVSGLATMSCIAGSDIINKSVQASLLGLYLAKNDKVKKVKKYKVVEFNSNEALFFDSVAQRYFTTEIVEARSDDGLVCYIVSPEYEQYF